MAQKWVTEDELNYMKMGGRVTYAQEGATAQDQVMQLIQAYAQEAGIDPKELIGQLQQMQPEQQQQAIQQMAQELQGGQEQNQSPQEEQGEMQGGQEQMMQQIAQAIQEGADPQEVMGALVQQGIPEEQAGQMIQAIAQQMQGAPQMAKGGMVDPEKAKQILKDGTIYGKSLTDKQRKFFGAMANKSEDGRTIVNFDSAATTQTAPIYRNPQFKNSGTVDGENTKYPFKQQAGGTAFYDEYRQDATQKLIQGGNLHTYEGKNIKAEGGYIDHGYNIDVPGPELMGRRKDYLMDGNYAKGGNVKTTWDNLRTKLNKNEEEDYSKWKSKLPERLQNDEDYDLKGFYKEFNKEPLPEGSGYHLIDRYKLPNHPSFSSESKYYNPETEYLGGQWQNQGDAWKYQPNSDLKQPIYENVPSSEIGKNFMQLGRPGVRRSDFTWDFSDPNSMEAGGSISQGYHMMPSGRLMSDAEHKPNGNVGKQDLSRFMTGNVSIQGGQGAKYDMGGLVPGGMLVGDKQYYPYGGYVEYNSEGGAPSQVGNRAEWLSRFGSVYPVKAYGGINTSVTGSPSNEIKTTYDFSKTNTKDPFIATPKDNTNTTAVATNFQNAQNQQQAKPVTPPKATVLPNTNLGQVPENRNYKGALDAGVTNIDEFMRYKKTGYANPSQIQEYGGYTIKAQVGLNTFNPFNQMPDGYQGVQIPQYGQGFGGVGINYQNVANGPQGGVGISTVNLNQGSASQKVGIKTPSAGAAASAVGGGLGATNPVSMGLNAAGGAMDATANLMASLGKEGSGAQAFGKGASEAMGVAGQITAPFKDIPVVGQALDVAGKVLGFLIGGPLEKRSADIRKEENKKAEKYADWAVKNQPSMVASQGQYMAKYGKNVRNMKQRIMDDIYTDFDKYMKK